MTTRERLTQIACHVFTGGDDIPCDDCRGVKDCVVWDDNLKVVDAILDELMEPGEGAIIAGALAMSGAMSHGEVGAAVIYGQPKDVWQAILTHIKDGKP